MTGREIRCIKLAEQVGLKNKSVIDIGCSFGWFCEEVLKKGAREVYGIEPDLEKIELAKKGVKGATFIIGSASHIPVKKKFDVAALFDVIEHVAPKSEEQVFREISKVLKSRGCLLISTPFDFLPAKLADPAWFFGHRHYSLEQLTKLLRRAGYRVTFHQLHGGFWEAVSMWVLYISKWILHIPMPFEEWFDRRRRKEFERSGRTHIFIIAQKTT